MRTNKRIARGPDAAHGGDDFAEKARAIFEGAAVRIGALIRERRKEFVEQVAVRGVDFDDFESPLAEREPRLR